MKLGDQIRAARRYQKLKIKDLSEATGISAVTIGKVERGKTDARISIVEKLAIELDICLTIGKTEGL